MEYKYRVEGYTEKAFILRRAHFRVGSAINTEILETELPFIKERCQLNKVEDLTATSQPIPNISQPIKKGAKDDLSKPSIATHKGKISEKISLAKPR